jgi:hypothetical protein
VAELSGALKEARPLQEPRQDGSAAGLATSPAATLRPQQVPLAPTAAELLEELRRHSDALSLLPRTLLEIARDVSQVLEEVRVQGSREGPGLSDLLEEIRAAAPPKELAPLLRELYAGGARSRRAGSPGLDSPLELDLSPVLEEIRRSSAQLVTQEVLHEQVSQEILREVQRLGQLQAAWC